jgi:hypothetical protein
MIRFLLWYWLPIAIYGVGAFLFGVWLGRRYGRREHP